LTLFFGNVFIVIMPDKLAPFTSRVNCEVLRALVGLHNQAPIHP
jgi:hypothetical protein